MNVHTFTVTLDQADGITAASMLELVAVNARRDAAEARRIDSPAGPKLAAINDELAADCERIAAAIRDNLAAAQRRRNASGSGAMSPAPLPDSAAASFSPLPHFRRSNILGGCRGADGPPASTRAVRS